MKTYLQFALVFGLALCAGCSQKDNPSKNIQAEVVTKQVSPPETIKSSLEPVSILERRFDFYDKKELFKHFKPKELRFKETANEIRNDSLIKIDSLTYLNILQNDTLLKYASLHDEHYYFAIQDSSGPVISIILANFLFGYALDFECFTFSRDGKKIDNKVLLQDFADAEVAIESRGFFKSDTSFLATWIRYSDNMTMDTLRVDSSNIVFRINDTGKITETRETFSYIRSVKKDRE